MGKKIDWIRPRQPDEPADRRNPPESWYDQDQMNRRIVLDISLLDLVTIHGSVVLASKHPQAGAYVKPLMLSLLDTFEATFVEAGLEEPPQGWRGDA